MPVIVLGCALLGLSVGSFLNVVAYRLPAGMSLSAPGSHCPACGHPIRMRHNLPVLGWLVLRGRCADCRTPISARYPAVEALTAVLFVVVGVRLAHLGLLAALPAYLYVVGLGVALAAIDLDTGRLPDRLVLPAYPVLAALLAAAALIERDPAALVRAGVGALATYAGFYLVLLARPGGMGYGDVKLSGLLAAPLAYLSYPALLVGIFAAFALGAVLGPVLQLSRPTRVAVGAPSEDRPSRRAIPFGPFLVAGALVGVLVGPEIGGLYARLLLTS